MPTEEITRKERKSKHAKEKLGRMEAKQRKKNLIEID
jgi:hypothetical protein